MPNIKSALKRVKTSEIKRKVNAANKSRLNTARRAFIGMVTGASADEVAKKEAFRKFCSVIDKSAKRGVISKNAAARRKSRAYAMLNKKTV